MLTLRLGASQRLLREVAVEGSFMLHLRLGVGEAGPEIAAEADRMAGLALKGALSEQGHAEPPRSCRLGLWLKQEAG